MDDIHSLSAAVKALYWTYKEIAKKNPDQLLQWSIVEQCNKLLSQGKTLLGDQSTVKYIEPLLAPKQDTESLRIRVADILGILSPLDAALNYRRARRNP